MVFEVIGVQSFKNDINMSLPDSTINYVGFAQIRALKMKIRIIICDQRTAHRLLLEITCLTIISTYDTIAPVPSFGYSNLDVTFCLVRHISPAKADATTRSPGETKKNN